MATGGGDDDRQNTESTREYEVNDADGKKVIIPTVAKPIKRFEPPLPVRARTDGLMNNVAGGRARVTPLVLPPAAFAYGKVSRTAGQINMNVDPKTIEQYNQLIDEGETAFNLLNLKPLRKLPPIPEGKFPVRCPIRLLNPPNMTEAGWKTMRMVSEKLYDWVYRMDEGYIWYARLYTMLFVHTHADGWFTLQTVPELFHYHFGEIFDYGRLPIKKPIDLAAAFELTIESWHSPLDSIRIRLIQNIHDSPRMPRTVARIGQSAGKYLLQNMRHAFDRSYGPGDKDLDNYGGMVGIPQLCKSTGMAFYEDSDQWHVDLCRKELFLLLLLHFPREGIEHRELMALISNRLAVVDYFSPTMWTQHEFETKVIAGSTWLSDIIDMEMLIPPRVLIYRCRFDNPDIVIDPDYIDKLAKMKGGDGKVGINLDIHDMMIDAGISAITVTEQSQPFEIELECDNIGSSNNNGHDENRLERVADEKISTTKKKIPTAIAQLLKK